MLVELHTPLPPFFNYTSMPQPQPSPSQSNNNGINIRDALSILSSRAKTGGDADIIKSSNNDNDVVVPNELKKMGQTIDIANEMEFTKSNDAIIGCNCAANNDNNNASSLSSSSSPYNDDVEEEKEKHEAMKLEREQRSRDIQTKLQSMDVVDLLKMIFTAQEERVATYKLFDE